MKDKIAQVLENVSGVKNPQVEFCANEKFGDYSSNMVMVNKDLKPQEIADKINNRNLDFTAEVVGKFINFRIKNEALITNLTKERRINKIGETIIVDYSAPNIAKPFGIGHLRSTIIGQAIYNLYKYLGYNVIGDNHLGDWGTQFGKLLYMIDSTKTRDFSIENLEKLYVEFHNLAKDNPKLEQYARDWFKKLEDNDTNARTIWKQCINVSLNEFQRIYDLLGIKIDTAYGESFYEEEMKEMINDKMIKDRLTKGDDGALIINLPNIKTPLMFLKSDGATTYATRDLATIRFRQKKYNPKCIIYEVGGEQKLHFEQVFAAARLLKIVDEGVELVHTAHGLYLAPDGKKFSTRKGKTIKLEEVLNEAIQRAKKLGNSDDETAKKVGIGAVKYFDLMHAVRSDVVFDWEKIMNMEGNSGPYLQYTIARCNSILAKSSIINFQFSMNFQLNNEELSILRQLAKFDEVIETAAKTYSPNVLCNYLYELASKFNTFYNAHKIIGGENEDFKLKLTQKTGQILKTGLTLLGIEAPQKM